MARKSTTATPNKSEAIRNYKAANPAAAPKEIAEGLGKDGLAVSAQFVSTVLSNAKKKGGKVGKRGRKPGGKQPAGMVNATDIQALLAAKRFVQTLGGDVQKAQLVLKGFAQLV